MVLNVVAFEPVDSLNIPIKFCPAEVEASRRNTISGCCTSDNIGSLLSSHLLFPIFYKSGETMRDIGTITDN
jgi:hypothetical protein